MRRLDVEIEQEFGPFSEGAPVHGVTYDGQSVWFASANQLRALDPNSGALTHSLEVSCDAGTAFDGEHLFQLGGGRVHKIDPRTGTVIATLQAAAFQGASGLAWAEGSLWVGRFNDQKILEVDPATGKVLSEVPSDRFVTGVSFCAGELWHGTQSDPAALRRVDPKTGAVLEELALPPGLAVSGLEADGQGRFFCGGGKSGKIRVVRQPKSKSRT